jgi:uncharacterized iron-regulated protein
VALLGTRNKRPEFLRFVSGLLRELEDAYVGLEIAKYQQPAIDRYLKEGIGRGEITLHHALDCPEYWNLFDILRDIRDKNWLKLVALDLPASLYGRKDTNRDEWMARLISRIFDEDPDARVLVIVGNLHVLKSIRWEEDAPAKHSFIRTYLCDIKRE